MPKAFFIVRAVVAAPLREKFDHWYATDHMPAAHAAFKSEKCWRFWSAREPGVHYAVYRFADWRLPTRRSTQRPSRRWSPISTARGRPASPAPAML